MDWSLIPAYISHSHKQKADETHQNWVLLNGIEWEYGIGKNVTNITAHGI